MPGLVPTCDPIQAAGMLDVRCEVLKMWPWFLITFLAFPTSSPSPQIQEMSRRIRDGVPLAGLNLTGRDEEWGVYLLFGDERDESGFHE